MPEFNCPKCASDQTAKVSAIFAAGTTAIETRTSGMGVGLTRGGFVPVVGSGTTRGVQQTQLAAQLAPPAREPMVKMFFGATFLFTPVVGGIVAIVLGLITGSSEAALAAFMLVATVVMVLTIKGCVRGRRDRPWRGIPCAVFRADRASPTPQGRLRGASACPGSNDISGIQQRYTGYAG